MSNQICIVRTNDIFIFISVDDESPLHYNEYESKNGTQTNTINYPYREYENEGNFLVVEMTVSVYVPFLIFARKKIASGVIRYRITKALNGKIDVTQTNLTLHVDKDNYSIVSTQNITRFNVNLHVPHGKDISVL